MSLLVKTAGALLFLFVIFLCVKSHVYANESSVSFSAIVTDSLNGKAASGATVVLPELKKIFSSDENGLVVIAGLTAVPSYMIVTADGYASQRVSLTNVTLSAPFLVKLVQTTSTDTSSVASVADTSTDRSVSDTSASASFQNSEEQVKPVVSESRKISGLVVDQKTGLPLPDAVVSVAALKEAVITDSVGKFSIHIPAAAPCSMTVVKSDYERLTVPSDSLDSGEVKIVLTQIPISKLKDMVVHAERVKQLIKTSDKIGQIKISPEIVSKLPGAGQDDLFRALQFLPGVSGSNETSAALFVRGGTPDQNLVLLDQVPIYYVDHFYGFFSTFNPHAIGDVTLHRGGFGARWGGRLSSVVDLVSSGMNASDTGGIKASIGSGLLSSDAYLQIPLNKNKTGTLMFAARRAMTDITKTDLFSSIFNRMHGNDTLYSEGSTGHQTYWELNPDSSYSIFPTMRGYRFVYQPKYYFWDLNGLAAFRLGTRGRLSTTFFASRDYQDNSLDTSFSEKAIRAIWLVDMIRNIKYFSRYDTAISVVNVKSKNPLIWGNFCAGQEWEQQWSDAFKSRLSLSYSQFLGTKTEDYYRRDSISVRYSDTKAPFDTTVGLRSGMNSRNKIVDFSGKLDNSFRLSDRNMLNMGIEVSWKSVVYDRDTVPDPGSDPGTTWGERFVSVITSTRPVHTRDTGVSCAFYAEDEMTFGDKAGMTPGVRYYYFQHSAAHAVDPRLSLWYSLLPGLKIKGACGIYTQEIHRAEEEDISGGSKFVWLLSNKNRPLEKSNQVLAGVSWETAHLLFDAEGYVKRLSGLLTISERMLSYISEEKQSFDPNQFALFEGTGFVRGVDLLIQIKNARFSLFNRSATYDGWIGYTLSRSENTYPVFNEGKPFPATYDHTHEFKIVNSLEWKVASWSSIGLGAVWMYSTGAPYTAPVEFFTLNQFSGPDNRTYVHVSDKNAYRLPEYHRLDISTAWKINIGNHFQSSLTLGLFNAYNRKNILERTYTVTTVNSYNYEFGYYDYNIIPDYCRKTVITKKDRKAMDVLPNAAFKVTAVF